MSGSDSLIHIRVGKKVKDSMQEMMDEGLFTNQTEIAREALRDLLLKYNKLQETNPSLRQTIFHNKRKK